jgi:hypothetical protein
MTSATCSVDAVYEKCLHNFDCEPERERPLEELGVTGGQ